jgi:hypothetical protein
MARSGSFMSIEWHINRSPGPPFRTDRPHNPCREVCRNA